MTRSLAAIALLVALVAPVAYASQHPLPAYMARIRPQIDSYRRVSTTLGNLLSELPITNVDPLVEKLDRVADRFDRLAGRWLGIRAPKGLRLRHRGMGRAFVLIGDAIRIHAAALFTRHLDEMQAAAPKVEARLRSAAYLQKRWAAALQGALIRAGLRVPRWLHGMAGAER